jgi:nucleolar protein 56
MRVMAMRTWFGELDDKKVNLTGHSADELVKWVESSDSEGLAKDMSLESLAIKSGICSSPAGYKRLLHETAMRLARDKIAGSLAGKDAYLMQAVKALDDLNEAYNIISERMAEWFGIHFPEKRMRPGELIDFILQYGSKDTSGRDEVASSLGAPMTEEDVSAIQGLALTAKALYWQRKALEDYINNMMMELAPNLSKVLGPILGARVIARAGSLEKLAKMPASSIQVMGAGEALFKHLKTGTPPPKHGLIYKHPLISGSPKKARGKISRMLAGKAAIAARVDYFSGEAIDMGDLKEKAAIIRSRARKKS